MDASRQIKMRRAARKLGVGFEACAAHRCSVPCTVIGYASASLSSQFAALATRAALGMAPPLLALDGGAALGAAAVPDGHGAVGVQGPYCCAARIACVFRLVAGFFRLLGVVGRSGFGGSRAECVTACSADGFGAGVDVGELID